MIGREKGQTWAKDLKHATTCVGESFIHYFCRLFGESLLGFKHSSHIATCRWCHSARPSPCIDISDSCVLVFDARRAHCLSNFTVPGSGKVAFAIEANLLTCCFLSVTELKDLVSIARFLWCERTDICVFVLDKVTPQNLEPGIEP